MDQQLTIDTAALAERTEAAEWILRGLPERVQHAHSTIQPTSTARYDAGGGGGRSRKKDALGYVPLNGGAMDACDEVFRILAEWVLVWAETQSIRPPRFDAWYTRGAVELEVQGLPAGATSTEVKQLVSLLEAFLRGQHLRMRHHVLFSEYLEAIEGLPRLIAAWPVEDRGPRRPRFRPCPLCGCASSVMAEQYGPDPDHHMHAVCTRCGETFTKETP